MRIPTEEEFKELIDKCTWKWGREGLLNGYHILGPNGNSIFLPAAETGDVHREEWEINKSEYGIYWTSTTNETKDEKYFKGLFFNNEKVRINDCYLPGNHFSIRYVSDEQNDDCVDMGLSVFWCKFNKVSDSSYFRQE